MFVVVYCRPALNVYKQTVIQWLYQITIHRTSLTHLQTFRATHQRKDTPANIQSVEYFFIALRYSDETKCPCECMRDFFPCHFARLSQINLICYYIWISQLLWNLWNNSFWNFQTILFGEWFKIITQNLFKN